MSTTVLTLVNNVLKACQRAPVETLDSPSSSLTQCIRLLLEEATALIPSLLVHHPDFREVLTKTPINHVIDLEPDKLESEQVLQVLLAGKHPLEFQRRTQTTIYVDTTVPVDVIVQKPVIRFDFLAQPKIRVFPFSEAVVALIQQFLIYRLKLFLGQPDYRVTMEQFGHSVKMLSLTRLEA